MNAKTINKKKVGQIVLYIVLVMLLIAIIGFFAYFTNGFTGDFKSFYVVVNDNKVMSTDSGYRLISSEPLKVDVCYTFGFLSEEISGYTVSVLPNGDFDFTVDGELYSFASETNLNAGFDIEYEEKSFTISPKGGLVNILESLYPEKEIIVDKTAIDFNSNLIKIVISSVDNKVSVSLDCVLSDCAIYDITLDREALEF